MRFLSRECGNSLNYTAHFIVRRGHASLHCRKSCQVAQGEYIRSVYAPFLDNTCQGFNENDIISKDIHTMPLFFCVGENRNIRTKFYHSRTAASLAQPVYMLYGKLQAGNLIG